ncbi:Protein OS-9 [Exophiala xenobiotica]|uniref:Endoplasmic reticulum lectin n=1 Tax=Lithohypha guttulata TaxID=1690604 RepID=A0ABR0K3S8_9EURO|nr:Protein OS-9 [Lithohypha guttulata]KAK5313458.1 Protein OS-9 [Exophiala xenobiotica]
MILAVAVLGLLRVCQASERKFDVKDDIFAFPQYDVSFSDSYVLRDDAIAKLDASPSHHDQGVSLQYEYLVGNGRPYLCAVPQLVLSTNETEENAGLETEHDLVAAADRGWQLLKDMEGQQCLYYTTGWWSYMFCYNSYVKQYHAGALNPQARQWPPPEDPNTPSYILGSYDSIMKKPEVQGSPQPKTGDLQTQSETTFLVQKLEGGTPCDLTGKPRRVEVQYHCSPGTPDRIGWIKETATCAYQMVVYTSRLCDDVVFQPPKEAHLHKIECEQILTEEEARDWQPSSSDAPQIDDSQQQRIMVGRVELGGKKLVGGDGKKIERGRIVMTPEEQAEIVVIQKDGQIQSLSTSELKKLELNPDEVAAFQKEMQKLAGGNDWKIERLGDANGQLSLRGVVDAKKKGKEQVEHGDEDDDGLVEADLDEAGSEEHYKHEF